MGLRQELTQKELILTQGAKVLSSAPVTASLTACISEIGLATKIRDTEERAGQRGFSTSAAGSVMALYVSWLTEIPNIAGHLLAASVMSAPAALMVAKIIYPETQSTKSINSLNINENSESTNITDIIKTPKKSIIPRSEKQKNYVRALKESEVIISTGPAGTGKTFLAVAVALTMLLEKKIERIKKV